MLTSPRSKLRAGLEPTTEFVVAEEARGLECISENVFLFEDTCNVYAIRSGREAVLIDFGDGEILDRLPSIGVERVTDILMTHHHRDQGQGLWRAEAAGIRIWVPQVEQDLFQDVEAHWQSREVYNNYNVRQDRFSLLEPVSIAGTLNDYGSYSFGSHVFTVVPTPGHTVGSISLLANVDGLQMAFTGDLIAAPGKVWSLSATQWSYNGAEGVAASIPSLLDLKSHCPDLLLPSHGDVIDEPDLAIDLLVERLSPLFECRGDYPEFFHHLDRPYEEITPHLLLNLTSTANSYVLLSESGKALLIDFGYDLSPGIAAGADRTSRRPWLYTLGALKRDFGVTKIDVAIPTHYHDDHVAGFNLLRRVEGTQAWAASNFKDILECPSDYDLPCLWYDPITVDRALPLGEPFYWEEHELTLYELPGHTLYAVAIAFEVDGRRVLATGDQYQGNDGEKWNYVYKNKFQIGHYLRTAELYRQLKPDLILSGHWDPLEVQAGYFDRLRERGETLARVHRELLPLDTCHFDGEGFGAWIQPYQVTAHGGEQIEFQVEVRNPFPRAEEALVRIVVPRGWQVTEPELLVGLQSHENRTVLFHVSTPAGTKRRRARVAADLTVGNRRFGQQAEALVTIV